MRPWFAITLLIASGCEPAEPARPPPVAAPPVLTPRDVCENAKSGAAPAPATLDKRKVALVCFDGGAEADAATLKAAVHTREGQTFDAATVGADVERLYGSGVLDDVLVELTELAEEVVVTFALKPRPRVTGVRFDGAPDMKDDELTSLFGVVATQRLDRAKVKQGAAKLREELFDQGYRFATVTPTATPGPNGAELRVAIDKGPLVKVASLVFDGSKAVTKAEIAKLTTTKAGEAFRAPWFERDLLLVQAAYYDRGMVLASLGAPEIVPSADHQTVAIRVPVTEGKVFRVRKLELRGRVGSHEKDYRALLKTRAGDVFRRGNLVAGVAAIRARRLELGEQGDIVPQTELDPSKSVMDVTLVLE